MMRRRPHAVQSDEGAAMVLVLIVVVLVALVSTSFLTKSATELKAGSILQTKVNLQYGADAGLEQGIKVMSADLANVNRLHCLTPEEPAKTIASFSWTSAGFAGTTTCQDLQGIADDSNAGALYGAAIVTTGGAGSLQTQSGASTELDVGGVIYVSGVETSNDLKKSILLTKGDYAVQGCSGTLVQPEVTTTAPYGKYCTSLTPAQVAPAVALPAVPATAPAPVLLPSGRCKVFYPGKYTTSPALLSGNNTGNYFASGTYYFDGAVTIDVPNNVAVVAGAPSPGDVPLVSTACTDDVGAIGARPSAAGSITSTGAAFIMGGASQISVASGSLLMYSRPISAGYAIPLSVYGVRSTDSGWDAWSGGSNPVVSNTNANGSMLFNGQINVYDAPVTLFASNPTLAVVRAGVVARTLLLKASSSGSNLDVSGYGSTPVAGFRIVKLTSHVAGIAGDSGAADGVAIVKLPNDLTAPTVLSWRFS